MFVIKVVGQETPAAAIGCCHGHRLYIDIDN